MNNETEKIANKENGIQKLSDDNLEEVSGGKTFDNKTKREVFKKFAHSETFKKRKESWIYRFFNAISSPFFKLKKK